MTDVAVRLADSEPISDSLSEAISDVRGSVANVIETQRARHRASKEPRTQKNRSRVAKTLLGTVPILLVSSIAMSLAAVAPAEAQVLKRPLKQRSQPQVAPEPHDTTPVTQPSEVLTGSTRYASTGATAALASAPAQAFAPTNYEVAEGDTVSDIAGRYGLSTASVLALNGLSWKSLIFPGQVLSLNTASTTAIIPQLSTDLIRYTIKAGDTISTIAFDYDLDTQALLLANGLGRDSIIYPGQLIVLPGSGVAVADGMVSTAEVSAAAASGDVIGLTEEMRTNARTIIAVGRGLGVDDYGLVIALSAAMQESSLRNLAFGDLDSLGLFQQRTSTGWGSVDQILDPVQASRAFFGGPGNPNAGVTRGLLDIAGWQSMTVTQAAQAVQISAYPEAYAKWEDSARAWLSDLG